MKYSATTILALCAFHPTAHAFVAGPAAAAAPLSTKPTPGAVGPLPLTRKPDYLESLEQNDSRTLDENRGTRTFDGRSSGRPIMDYPTIGNTGGQLSRTGAGDLSRMGGGRVESVHDVWDSIHPQSKRKVQGDGALQTWSFDRVERAQVLLKTDTGDGSSRSGQPLEASVEMWAGPDNSPQKMVVYSEDGTRRPVAAAIMMPYDYTSTVAVRNIGHMSFPIVASVEADDRSTGLAALTGSLPSMDSTRTIQGGSLSVYRCDPYEERVQVFLETEGRPLNARIELMEGPNSVKQVIDLSNDNGIAFPFLTVLETPSPGSVVRIVNTGPMEFPIYASVEPIGGYGRGRGYRGRDNYDEYRGGNGVMRSGYDRSYGGSYGRGGGVDRNGYYGRGSSYGDGSYYSDRSNNRRTGWVDDQRRGYGGYGRSSYGNNGGGYGYGSRDGYGPVSTRNGYGGIMSMNGGSGSRNGGRNRYGRQSNSVEDNPNNHQWHETGNRYRSNL